MTETKTQRFTEIFTLLLSALAGAAGGFFMGRSLATGGDQALNVLSNLLQGLIKSQNSGPIVATGIAAAASILGAVLVPAVTVFVLEITHRKTRSRHEVDDSQT